MVGVKIGEDKKREVNEDQGRRKKTRLMLEMESAYSTIIEIYLYGFEKLRNDTMFLQLTKMF